MQWGPLVCCEELLHPDMRGQTGGETEGKSVEVGDRAVVKKGK